MPNETNDASREEVMQQLKALGYVDPGAGSSMWQVMLGSFFRISAGIRAALKKVFRSSGPGIEED